MKNHKSLLPILFAINASAMLIANITAGKQFAFLGFALPCAVIIFPVTYILSDVFSEVYGYRWTRRSAWTAFAMNVFAVLAFQLTIVLPGVAWFKGQEAFQTVLGNTPRILAASLLSYMLGDWVNDIVFQRMKEVDGANRRFGLRAVVSSCAGQFTDSMIFIPLAFIGEMPIAQMATMILIQPAAKLVLEIVLLPLTRLCVSLAKKHAACEEV